MTWILWCWLNNLLLDLLKSHKRHIQCNHQPSYHLCSSWGPFQRNGSFPQTTKAQHCLVCVFICILIGVWTDVPEKLYVFMPPHFPRLFIALVNNLNMALVHYTYWMEDLLCCCLLRVENPTQNQHHYPHPLPWMQDHMLNWYFTFQNQ